MKASLIIPTCNKLPRLKLVLTSLEIQRFSRDDFEVVIVDNGSDDGTKEFLDNLNPPYAFTTISTEQTGRANARNVGAAHAKNEVLIFTDDDLVLSPDFIGEHVREHEKRKCVVHGKIYNISEVKFLQDPENGIYYSYLNRTRPLSKAAMKVCVTKSNILENFEETIGKINRITEMEKAIREVLCCESSGGQWIGFTGGNCSIRRTDFLDSNGFDEKFGTRWGCEDFELGYRLKQLGYDFVYSDKACNYHLMHYRPDFMKEHSLNVNYFYEKHNHDNIIHLQEFIEQKITVEQFVHYLKKLS